METIRDLNDKPQITVTNTDGCPVWAVNKARELAAKRGLTTISMDEFFASDEYYPAE